MTMLPRNLLFVLIAGVGWVGFAGCRGEAARSPHATRAQMNSGATVAMNEAGHIPRNATHSHPLRRNTTHESFLSTYNNPEEGISFRYPRNYSLEEGDIEEHSFFLQRQEDLDSEQSGAKLLATVLMPEDGYPNTTFEHGSLQLAVNEADSEKGCLAASEVGGTSSGSRALTIQGVAFHWTGEETEIAGSKILERKYAGYSEGTCYQFRLVLAADESPDPDGFTKKADMIRIMKQLENIVGSSRFFTKSEPAPVEISEETDRL
jgi:hypothetical protein